MSERWWSDDDQLLAVLAEALAEEHEVPPQIVNAGKAVFAARSLDSELAELIYDSLATAQPVPTRTSRAAIRELTFASRELRFHLQVSATSLHGQLVPPQRGEVEVHTADHPPQVVEVDEFGWFTITPVPRTSFRLFCRTRRGISTLTDWLSV
ncbi:MAG TPA: hypothetical protein VHH34_03425 [Pseudonocardiaceae bacterium]|nr:hypothetical protein [Pseudonocardiaceae bacterium]